MPTEIKGVAAIVLFASKPKAESEIVRWSAAVDHTIDTGFVDQSGFFHHVGGQGVVKMKKPTREHRMKVGNRPGLGVQDGNSIFGACSNFLVA